MLREGISSWEILDVLEKMNTDEVETYTRGGVLLFLVDINKNKELIEKIIPSENMQKYKQYCNDTYGFYEKDEEKGLLNMCGVIQMIEEEENKELLYIDGEFSYSS